MQSSSEPRRESPRVPWAEHLLRNLGASSETAIRRLFADAGIRIGGDAPWDLRINDSRFYARALEGSLGLGESYVDGWWDCDRIDELVARALTAELDRKARLSREVVVGALKARVLNMQRTSRAYGNIAHYDVGNRLFEEMLGPTMAYSCAYWKNAQSLDEAQRNKFDLICKKLQLQKGQDRKSVV